MNWFKDQLKQNDRIERDENFLQSIKINSQLSQLSQVKLSFQSVNTQPSHSQSSNGDTDKKDLFKGLVFASSQRLWHRRDELSDLIESLGGIFLWSFDRTCTHYLHQGKLADEAFKEFKQARQWDKFIVSPWWVIKCKDGGRKLDELQYPHTFKNETSTENTTTSNSNSSTSSDTKDTPENIPGNTLSQSHSQTTNLDWDAIMAERKAQEFLLRPGSKTFNIESHVKSLTDQSTKSTTFKPTGTHTHLTPRYKIVFSGYTSAEKSELIKLASNRPEFRVVPDDEAVEWNRKSTLLICNSLNFTEKIFSACASGCWILKKEFLMDQCTVGSDARYNFNFEKYELGPAWNANERDSLIGRAPKYWRQKLGIEVEIQDLRPFAGWNCALFVENTRQSLYESVLRNGGAQIIQIDPLSPIIPSVTHFFCANIKSIPEAIRKQLRNDQVFPTKHITNTIFRLND